MFTQILFPVDFTGSSVTVVPFVRDVAKKYHAVVHVVHVVAEVGSDLYVGGEAMVAFLNEIRESAQNMMDEFLAEHFSDMPKVHGHVLDGDPVDAILEFAGEKKVNLIIMSTHGRKGLDRIVFGSVAENVVRSSSIPVMTINPHLVGH